jgi:hypothetical protein
MGRMSDGRSFPPVVAPSIPSSRVPAGYILNKDKQKRIAPLSHVPKISLITGYPERKGELSAGGAANLEQYSFLSRHTSEDIVKYRRARQGEACSVLVECFVFAHSIYSRHWRVKHLRGTWIMQGAPRAGIHIPPNYSKTS